MDKRFRDIPLFVEVARQKSFTRAAQALNIPIPTLSMRIAAMERDLDIPLFIRSARKIEMTEAGQTLYEHCSFLVTEAEAAFEKVLQETAAPRGRVSIAIPSDEYHTYLRGVLSSFALQWPGISLRAALSPVLHGSGGGQFDLEIRVGPLPDSERKARKLFSLAPYLYASPRLLERRPGPEKPEDLGSFPCIALTQQPPIWPMSKGKRNVAVKANNIVHAVNAASVGLEFALAGFGAAWLTSPLASRYEKSGDLVQLLPGWSARGGVAISLVMSAGQLPKRVRLLADHLVDHCAAISM